jgi:hypothetical protein
MTRIPNHTAPMKIPVAAASTSSSAANRASTVAPGKSIAGKHRIRHHAQVRLIEIRSYELKPGTRDEYDRLFREEAAPLLRQFEIDVVAVGPSTGDPNGCFLIRAFDDLDDREQSEEAFYSSPAWREGPRQPVLDCIVTYTDAVLELPDELVEALRRSLAR